MERLLRDFRAIWRVLVLPVNAIGRVVATAGIKWRSWDLRWQILGVIVPVVVFGYTVWFNSQAQVRVIQEPSGPIGTPMIGAESNDFLISDATNSDEELFLNLYSNRTQAHVGDEVDFNLTVKNNSKQRLEVVNYSGHFNGVEFIGGTYEWTRDGQRQGEVPLEPHWISGHSMSWFNPGDQIDWKFSGKVGSGVVEPHAAKILVRVWTGDSAQLESIYETSVRIVDDSTSIEISWCSDIIIKKRELVTSKLYDVTVHVCNDGDVVLRLVSLLIDPLDRGSEFVNESVYYEFNGARHRSDCEVVQVCSFPDLQPGDHLEFYYQVIVPDDLEYSLPDEQRVWYFALESGWLQLVLTEE